MEIPSVGKRLEIIRNAMKYKTAFYHGPIKVDEMRWNLANIGPFVIGVPVHENFSELVDDVVLEPSGRLLDSHALLIIGYGDNSSTF